MTTSRAIRAKRTKADYWHNHERYEVLGERMMLAIYGHDMTPPFPSQTRLHELAAILAQQYFIAKVPMRLRIQEVV